MALERSFLGEAATRIGRLLGLGGMLTPKFNEGEGIAPILLLGDGTEPGYGDRSGRRWAIGGVAAGAGVGAYIGIEATSEIIVEGVGFSTNTAAGQYTLKWNTATEASPSGATFPTFVPALDRASSVNVAAPVLFLAQGGAAPAGVTSRTLWSGLGGLNYPVTFLHRFHMMPGSRLWLEYSTVAATIYANFYGRSF